MKYLLILLLLSIGCSSEMDNPHSRVKYDKFKMKICNNENYDLYWAGVNDDDPVLTYGWIKVPSGSCVVKDFKSFLFQKNLR